MITKFKDSTGSEWEISLPFGTIQHVAKETCGRVNLLEPMVDDLYQRLFSSYLEFFEVLVLVLDPQLKKAGKDGADFGAQCGAESFREAKKIFFEVWLDFFRQLHRQEIVAAMEAMLAVEAKAMEVVRAKIEQDKTLLELPGKMGPKLESELMKVFSDLRESCDSILNDTPGENSGTETKESFASIDY